MINIALLNSKTAVTRGSKHPHIYGVGYDYYFNERSELVINFGGDEDKEYVIPLAELTVAGEVPTDISDAYTKLAAVFPDANSGSGGSGVTIYGPYASNAAAITAGREAGDLYKSTDMHNDSLIILMVV